MPHRNRVRIGAAGSLLVVVVVLGIVIMHETPFLTATSSMEHEMPTDAATLVGEYRAIPMSHDGFHGAAALCLWTLVGGILVAAVGTSRGRRRVGVVVRGKAPIRAPARRANADRQPGPDPPLLLCVLQR